MLCNLSRDNAIYFAICPVKTLDVLQSIPVGSFWPGKVSLINLEISGRKSKQAAEPGRRKKERKKEERKKGGKKE